MKYLIEYGDDGDKGRLQRLRRKLVSAGALEDGKPLSRDRTWLWPEVTKLRYADGPLCSEHWQADWDLKNPKWGFCFRVKRTGEFSQSVRLDTLSLARIVDEYKPSDGWVLDESMVSRAEYVDLALRHDYAKEILARTLIENSLDGDFLAALVDGGLDGAKAAAIEDLKARIGSIELFGSGGRKLKKVDGQPTAVPIKDPNQAMKLEELEAILDILESL